MHVIILRFDLFRRFSFVIAFNVFCKSLLCSRELLWHLNLPCSAFCIMHKYILAIWSCKKLALQKPLQRFFFFFALAWQHCKKNKRCSADRCMYLFCVPVPAQSSKDVEMKCSGEKTNESNGFKMKIWKISLDETLFIKSFLNEMKFVSLHVWPHIVLCAH